MTTDDNTPLCLADAIPLAFPGGGMTVSGLRKEAKRGNLTLERIAARDFVTLRAIREMRERCQIPARKIETRADAKISLAPVSAQRPRYRGQWLDRTFRPKTHSSPGSRPASGSGERQRRRSARSRYAPPTSSESARLLLQCQTV